MHFRTARLWLLFTLFLPFGSTDILADETTKPSNHVIWDRFRGPNGTGTTDEKDIPLEFGTNKNLIWKAVLPGTGNSSPVVWGKHLFLQSASDDGKQRSLLCLDTA